MIKPRATVTRHIGFSPGLMQFFEIEEWQLAAWCQDEKAKTPPVQVHFILKIAGFRFPFLLRFKSPDTLGFLIEELNRYRREVWPDSDPVDLERGFENDQANR